MRHTPYIIMLLSDKGGVGKTTVAVNLAVALRGYGFRVLLIESDMFNPSIAFHLDIEARRHDFIDYAEGRCTLADAVVTHGPSSLDVLPCAINKNPIAIKKSLADSFMSDIVRRSGYDFVIIDTEPGRFENELANYVDEAMLLATPDIPSVVSIIRLGIIFARHNVKNSVLINMRRNKGYELSRREIEEVSENRVADELPYTDLVPVSINRHIPAVLLNRSSRFSRGMRLLAQKYITTSGLADGSRLDKGILGSIVDGIGGREKGVMVRGRRLEKVRQIAEDEEEYEEEAGASAESAGRADSARVKRKEVERGDRVRLIREEVDKERKALARGVRGAGRIGYEGVLKTGSAVARGGVKVGQQVERGISREKQFLANGQKKRARRARKVVHVKL